MSDLLLANARVVLDRRIARGSVAVNAGLIEQFIPDGAERPAARRVIDLADRYLAPGLIDIHIHGSHGVDVQEASDAELDRLAGWLAEQGTTRFVPTFVPAALDALTESTRAIGRQMERAGTGAVPVGVHFEGPFVSHARCGALKREFFIEGAERARFFEAVAAAGLPAGAVRMMTIAPEIPGGLELVADAVERGFVVSIGHTEADEHALAAALARGARHMTHLANAMRPIHHRSPGPIVWGLVEPDVTVDVIADFKHLHPDMLRLVFAAKSFEGVALISDAIAPTGLGDGDFSVWGEAISVHEGTTANSRGAIAGSVITLYGAFTNAIRLGVAIEDAVRMASTVPARVLGLTHHGAIAPGHVADLIVFDDALRIGTVLIAGHELERG